MTTFALGDIRLTMISDGALRREDLAAFTATNAAPEEVAAVARAQHLPFPSFVHGFTGALIETGDAVIAVDPGFGVAAPGPAVGQYLEGLAAAGRRPEDVTMVLISHGHPDHIGNVGAFPNAEIAMSAREFAYWEAGDVPEFRAPTLGLFQKLLAPRRAEIRMLEPGQSVAPGVSVAEGFGHSAGHLLFRVGDLVMLNDAVPHFAISMAKPEWHFAMDDDPEAAAVTRRRELAAAADGRYPVSGFHFPFPSVGYIDRQGDGFVFRPHSYQLLP